MEARHDADLIVRHRVAWIGKCCVPCDVLPMATSDNAETLEPGGPRRS
jgi:hypothetical protein